jgi:exosortase B
MGSSATVAATAQPKGPPPPGILDLTWIRWLPLVLALLAVLVPLYGSFSQDVWHAEEHGHGPMILMISAYFVWKLHEEAAAARVAPQPLLGVLMMLCGLALYVVGHSQSVAYVAAFSALPIIIGVLLALRGWPTIRVLWFPLFFLIFAIPMPGFLMDVLTQPLKHWVSVIAEELLYMAGYPIARVGVTLTIGQYHMLVADACSGLNSMFSLSALGLLYLYMMQHQSVARNALMMLAILPIAFCANIVRVLILVLVTYYLGDEAGQGFLHGFAGMVLFVIALAMLFGFDGLLGLVFKNKKKPTAAATPAAPGSTESSTEVRA